MNEPVIQVGILLNQSKIDFSLLNTYTFAGKEFAAGDYSVELSDDKILFNGNEYDELTFKSDNLHTDSFELKDVIIGVNFHWERKENQRFWRVEICD